VRELHLIEQTEIKAILCCSVAGNPAAILQQLIGALQAGEMLLEGVYVLQADEATKERVQGWEKTSASAPFLSENINPILSSFQHA
jgi:hypothetical protein